MKTYALAMFFLLILTLQISFVAALRPLGVVPDIALITVIIAGLSSTVSLSLALAVMGGVVLDLASGSDFGLRTGLFVMAALATGVVRRAGLTLGGPLVAGVLVAVATLLQTIIIIGNMAGTLGHWPISFIMRTFAIELMLNLILTVLIRPVVVWLSPKDTALPVVE